MRRQRDRETETFRQKSRRFFCFANWVRCIPPSPAGGMAVGVSAFPPLGPEIRNWDPLGRDYEECIGAKKHLVLGLLPNSR